MSVLLAIRKKFDFRFEKFEFLTDFFYGNSNFSRFISSRSQSWFTSFVTSARFLSLADLWTKTPVLKRLFFHFIARKLPIILGFCQNPSLIASLSWSFAAIWNQIGLFYGQKSAIFMLTEINILQFSVKVHYNKVLPTKTCWSSIIRLLTSGCSFGCLAPFLYSVIRVPRLSNSQVFILEDIFIRDTIRIIA